MLARGAGGWEAAATTAVTGPCAGDWVPASWARAGVGGREASVSTISLWSVV